MIEHFSKRIEFVAWLQNSSKLVALAFFDYILIYFGALIKILVDQKKEFLEAFEALFIKALKDHFTTYTNYCKSDSLAQCIV